MPTSRRQAPPPRRPAIRYSQPGHRRAASGSRRSARSLTQSRVEPYRARPDKESVILGEHAFGHVGAGGSIGFADPSCGLAFGYTMNRMGKGTLLNERGQSMVDGTYRILGHRSDTSGSWVT
jgi:CubicO group peptidase (beta-lactamase class C family)